MCRVVLGGQDLTQEPVFICGYTHGAHTSENLTSAHVGSGMLLYKHAGDGVTCMCGMLCVTALHHAWVEPSAREVPMFIEQRFWQESSQGSVKSINLIPVKKGRGRGRGRCAASQSAASGGDAGVPAEEIIPEAEAVPVGTGWGPLGVKCDLHIPEFTDEPGIIYKTTNHMGPKHKAQHNADMTPIHIQILHAHNHR